MRSWGFIPIWAMAAYVCASSTPSAAFELAGLRSGMSPREVQAAAPLGFGVKMIQDNIGIVTDGKEVFASIAFCDDRLIHVIRMIDADVEWLPAVQAAISDRGQPKVLTDTTAWPGPGGGNVKSLVLRWLTAGYRFDLSISPEGRDGKGNLRNARGASISMVQIEGNRCYRQNG